MQPFIAESGQKFATSLTLLIIRHWLVQLTFTFNQNIGIEPVECDLWICC